MSLWFRTRDKDGTVHYITVPFEPLTFIAAVAIAVMALLPILAMFRNAVATAPTMTSFVCASILLAGLTMFAVAKSSVIRAGHLVSFGPRRMKRAMRWFYWLGYCLMLVGAILVTLFVLAVSTIH